MSSMLRELGRMFGRTPKQKWRHEQLAAGAYLKNTRPPKSHDRALVSPAPPLQDPIRTLGHPARGRKHR